MAHEEQYSVNDSTPTDSPPLYSAYNTDDPDTQSTTVDEDTTKGRFEGDTYAYAPATDMTYAVELGDVDTATATGDPDEAATQAEDGAFLRGGGASYGDCCAGCVGCTCTVAVPLLVVGALGTAGYGLYRAGDALYEWAKHDDRHASDSAAVSSSQVNMTHAYAPEWNVTSPYTTHASDLFNHTTARDTTVVNETARRRGRRNNGASNHNAD